MDRGVRLNVLKKTAARLAADSWADIGLTLRNFEYETAGISNWEDDYEYVVMALEQGTDSQLLELHRHFFPQDSATELPTEPEAGRWRAGAFRLFISHTSEHRARAGGLREWLGGWGVDGFVAHDTIEPTQEWREEIETALRTCHALCALLTPDFVRSRWCDQEVGFAVARSILVVPVKLEEDPYGFIGKYQAINFRSGESVRTVAGAVFDALAKSDLTASAMAPSIVHRYEHSHSFENTRQAFALLQTLPRSAWTQAMMDAVERAPKSNNQVGHANLPGGRSVPEAAQDLLQQVRGEPAVPALTADDDIPF